MEKLFLFEMRNRQLSIFFEYGTVKNQTVNKYIASSLSKHSYPLNHITRNLIIFSVVHKSSNSGLKIQLIFVLKSVHFTLNT